MGKIIVNGTEYSRNLSSGLSDALDTLDELTKYIEKEHGRTNCPNCGAPITGRECEYCRTKFY